MGLAGAELHTGPISGSTSWLIRAPPAEFAVFDRDLDAAWTERYLKMPRLAVDTEAMGLIHGRDRLILCRF